MIPVCNLFFEDNSYSKDHQDMISWLIPYLTDVELLYLLYVLY